MSDLAASASNLEKKPTIVKRRMQTARVIGLFLVIISLITTAVAFAILLGFTPIEPSPEVTRWIVTTIGVLIFCLILSVGWEVVKLLRARQKGRAAARLHIRIVTLFALIAAVPAMVVAVVASFTLDQGLDRWFSTRTQTIVDSSVTVARSYLDEHARFLLADISAVANDFTRLDSVLADSVEQRKLFLTTQARIRNIPHLQLVDRNGNMLEKADIPTPREWPKAPKEALDDAASTLDQVPVFINPGRTRNLVGAIIQVDLFEKHFLYAIRSVDPQVIDYLREAEENSEEYNNLRGSRASTQIAFALLYIGVTLVLLVSSVWVAINFADGIVKPIRQLMTAAAAVSKGDLSVQVPVRKREGDIGALSETFNVMTSQLNDQRQDILLANEKLDHRRRFIETVLSGVSAGVVGLSADGIVEVVNRSALSLINAKEEGVIGEPIKTVIPEISDLIDLALDGTKEESSIQVSLIRRGMEQTVNARLTAESNEGVLDGFVLTLDDITDLVTAQRTSAWADVARRIAHEIKNPLTPIQLSAERLRRRFGKDLDDKDQEIFDKCTSTIVRQVGDIGRMVDEFSSFARMPKPTFTKGDLRDCLREAVYVREVAEPHITFSIDLPKEPMTTQFDERLLSQAFTNLVKNAGEAIPETDDEGMPIKGSVALSGYRTGDNLIVEIVDNGKWWPKENRHKLLEPYMTTRKKGTGLGLAIVVKVVEDHKGKVELLDAPNYAQTERGAMVRITLPSFNEDAGDEPIAAE